MFLLVVDGELVVEDHPALGDLLRVLPLLLLILFMLVYLFEFPLCPHFNKLVLFNIIYKDTGLCGLACNSYMFSSAITGCSE